MASQVQAADSADNSVASIAYGSNVAANNLGILTVRVGTGDGTITAVTDSLGSTWAKVGTSQSISGGVLDVWWTVFASSGANTVSFTGGTARSAIEEINGLGAGATVDQNNAATGTSSAPSSGSITTTAATWIHCGLAMTNYPSVAPTVGSGWTAQANAGNKYSTEHRNEPSIVTVSGNWTLPESNTWASIVAAFKAAGGSNTNIQPSAGALGFTGNAPTVTVSGGVTRQPSVGALSLTGIASTLTLTLPAPDTGTLAFTGYAPTVTVTNVQNIQPAAGSLAFTGYAPTVTNTSSRNISPAVGTLTFVGYAPTVTIYVPTRQPSAGSLAFTGYAPSVSVRSPNSGATQQRNRRRRGILNMIWGR